jgi:branched-subunit amino acid aminotransferase/4-amino-4-deoxychorismate lyase
MDYSVTQVYLNGEFVSDSEARIPATDRGLLHGRGLFETFRVRRRQPVYRLDQHLERMRTGAEFLGITPVPSRDSVEPVVRDLVDRCELDVARVRMTLTAGREGGRGASLLIQAWAATEYSRELYEVGASAETATVRRNETSPLCRIKSLNCLDNLLARDAARQAGANEALLLNTRGLVAEGSVSNVFVVRDRQLITPPVKDGVLPGVTRAAVLDIAREAGVEVAEVSIHLDDIAGADEAFLTNAVAGVLPLTSVNGVSIGQGKPGELTLRLRMLYEAAREMGEVRGS